MHSSLVNTIINRKISFSESVWNSKNLWSFLEQTSKDILDYFLTYSTIKTNLLLTINSPTLNFIKNINNGKHYNAVLNIEILSDLIRLYSISCSDLNTIKNIGKVKECEKIYINRNEIAHNTFDNIIGDFVAMKNSNLIFELINIQLMYVLKLVNNG